MNITLGQNTETSLPESAPRGHVAQLRILSTSDMHMHVLAYDYGADRPAADIGLSRTAALIAAARAEAGPENCILVDNGDFLQGNALGDFMAENGGDFAKARHPMIAAMNHLGYDAANLGNHEFSHGLPFLRSCIAAAQFPFVSSNTWLAGNGADFVAPWIMVDRRVTDSSGRDVTLRIGIAGVLPPQTTMWDQVSIAGQLQMGPMRDTLARVLPEIRAAGADVIVVLAHCGLGTPEDEADPFAENMGAAIARLPDVDALVLGHVHLTYPLQSAQPLPRDVPAVMSGAMASHLGVIDLTLIEEGGKWRVARHSAEPRAIAQRSGQSEVTEQAAPDPVVEQIAAPAHAATLAWMREPIARIDRPLHSFFALVSACPVVQIMNMAKIAYVQKRIEGTEWQGLPVLSCNSPAHAGARGGAANFSFVPAGYFLRRHAVDVDPHPNSIMAMHLWGHELTRWLDRSALVFQQVDKGARDHALLRPEFPPFNFDTISGLTYEIDISAKGMIAGESRIRNLCYNGLPVAPDDKFIIAMSSYRASGSGGFAAGLADRIMLSDPLSCREILVDYLKSRDGALPDFARGWRFAPMAGTTVTFESAPEAMDHLADVPDLVIEPLGLTAEGFRQYRLHL